MSRTIRRKTHSKHFTFWSLPKVDPRTKEGKKELAKYHADQTVRWTEPGPHWFRNLTTERPQRREAKQQLHRYVQGEEFEVILEAKMPLDYWT